MHLSARRIPGGTLSADLPSPARSTRSGPSGSLGALCKNIFTSEFDHVALDVDRVVLVVDVLPFQAAAFTPADSCSDNELVVGFVLEAFILQPKNTF